MSFKDPRFSLSIGIAALSLRGDFAADVFLAFNKGGDMKDLSCCSDASSRQLPHEQALWLSRNLHILSVGKTKSDSTEASSCWELHAVQDRI